MSSPARSPTKTKKVHRHASKSPKRRISPSRIQADVHFEAHHFAYSDPLDSNQSLIQTVAFERRDRETLSPQATELFNSRTIFEDEQERTWLLDNMRSTTILIKVDDTLHAINGNYAVKEHQPCLLLLHGFGPGSNWANWIKLAYPMYQRGRYSVILIDFPGFGQSSGRNLDQTSWKRYGPEIIIAVLSSFQLTHAVHVVAECGGAATIVRTINRYAQWFRGRSLVFVNSVIGDFGESKAGRRSAPTLLYFSFQDFETCLGRFNISILVHWIPDRDHTKYCAAYKRWNRLRQAGFANLRLIDLEPTKQTMKTLYPAFSDDYIQQIFEFLQRK